MIKESIVISLGGSVVASDDVTPLYFQQLSLLLKRFSKQYDFYIIIGGGSLARTYIKRGRLFKFSEFQLDELGIMVTRINARFMSFILDVDQKHIPETTNDAASMKSSIVLMGGTDPGHSTDFVGAELTVKTNASHYVIATNVDGVYDKDPRKNHDAVFLPFVHINDLLRQYGSSWGTAGSNMVIDGPALQLIKEHRITTSVINGKNLNELQHILEKKPFYGTQIKV